MEVSTQTYPWCHGVMVSCACVMCHVSWVMDFMENRFSNTKLDKEIQYISILLSKVYIV